MQTKYLDGGIKRYKKRIRRKRNARKAEYGNICYIPEAVPQQKKKEEGSSCDVNALPALQIISQLEIRYFLFLLQ